MSRRDWSVKILEQLAVHDGPETLPRCDSCIGIVEGLLLAYDREPHEIPEVTMKTGLKLQLDQEAIKEAIQLYVDKNFTPPAVVTGVSRDGAAHGPDRVGVIVATVEPPPAPEVPVD